MVIRFAEYSVVQISFGLVRLFLDNMTKYYRYIVISADSKSGFYQLVFTDHQIILIFLDDLHNLFVVAQTA